MCKCFYVLAQVSVRVQVRVCGVCVDALGANVWVDTSKVIYNSRNLDINLSGSRQARHLRRLSSEKRRLTVNNSFGSRFFVQFQKFVALNLR